MASLCHAKPSGARHPEPIEYGGTFPLPERSSTASSCASASGTSARQEMAILDSQQHHHPIETLERVVESRLEEPRPERSIYVDDLVKEYIVSWSMLPALTRTSTWAPARAGRWRCTEGQARAALEGRATYTNVKALARPMLAHRLIISPSARIRTWTRPQS